MHELRQIIELWDKEKDSDNRLALATLISSHGPSYRSPGAMALIVDDGACRGSISAGCLEKDIACRLDSGTTEPFLLRYDLSVEDEVRGFPFGCGGDVEILVEPLIKSRQPNAIQFIEDILKQDTYSVSLLIIETSERVSEIYSIRSGERFFETNLPKILSSAKCKMIEAVAKRRCTMFEHKTEYGVIKALVHFIEKPVAITIFGDSEDACILETIARAAGFEVLRYTRKVLRETEDLSELTTGDYFVVMNHDLNLDRKITEAILQSKSEPKYLGLLGPRLRSEKFADLSNPSIYAPVGLDLEAETPGEIALSILAEIQSVTRRKSISIQHLRDRNGAIHERDTKKLGAAILAAGSSSRLGSPKQLVEFDGSKLLERAQSALKNIKITATILGANRDQIIEECELVSTNRIIQNLYWQEGLASSIRCAAQFAKQNGCSHLLLTTCDQPAIDERTIDSLCELSRKNSESIIACKYDDTTGIPAIFPEKYFEQLLELSGDRGAKKIIESSNNVVVFELQSAALDIDCEQDLLQSHDLFLPVGKRIQF